MTRLQPPAPCLELGPPDSQCDDCSVASYDHARRDYLKLDAPIKQNGPSSLYEAAALGVAEFRRCGLIDALPGPVTMLSVAVESSCTRQRCPCIN